jgi:hypothetical protein
MKDSAPDENWEPRIGKAASDTLLGANHYAPYLFITLGAMFVIMLLTAIINPIPLWLGILMTVGVLAVIFFFLLTAFSSWSRSERAGRQAFEFLGRPPQCGKGTFPAVMLKDYQRFDNYLVANGIPQKGCYTSIAEPQAYRIAAKRKPSRQ